MYITDRPIDLNQYVEALNDPDAGALVIFTGTTRNVHEGKPVKYLEYESQVSMAEKSIENILHEAKKRWKLTKAIAVHRIGRVNIGETSIVIVTGASHRHEAYEANRYILDTIKSETPVWKNEFYKDGKSSWQ